MEFVAHVDETGKPWYVKFEFLGSAQNLNYLCLIFDFRRRNKKKNDSWQRTKTNEIKIK